MNEQITELYVQANKYASDTGFKKYDKAGDVNWQWEDTVFEKFAELIVRQCIFEMMHESTLQDNTKIQDFSVAVANRIEKHFGVEL